MNPNFARRYLDGIASVIGWDKINHIVTAHIAVRKDDMQRIIKRLHAEAESLDREAAMMDQSFIAENI